MNPERAMCDEDLLRRQERDAIANQYRTAYKDTRALDDDLEGWSDEGVWPDE